MNHKLILVLIVLAGILLAPQAATPAALELNAG